MMRYSLLYSVITLAFLTACVGNKKEMKEEASPIQDTITVVRDTIDSIAGAGEIPLAADGFFDDFIYEFMKRPKRQIERIKFPLTVVKNGEVLSIEQKEWQFNRLYSQLPVHIQVYQSEKTIGVEKDTAMKSVLVDMVDLKKDDIKQYLFQKERGQWRLTEINEHALDKSVNNEFYTFYKKFANSTSYQIQHIRRPFDFKTYDENSSSTIEGTLDPEQFQDYAPQFPQSLVAMIYYGQTFANSTSRVLVFSEASGGMSSTLAFRKNKGKWQLYKLSN